MEKTFADERRLNAEYGQQASAIRLRIAVLEAAPSLATVPAQPPPRRHQLKGDMDELFAVDLKHPYRLVFHPWPDVPRRKDGGIDLERVTRIEILRVEDYH
jgi:proteic killer suppression protein